MKLKFLYKLNNLFNSWDGFWCQFPPKHRRPYQWIHARIHDAIHNEKYGKNYDKENIDY